MHVTYYCAGGMEYLVAMLNSNADFIVSFVTNMIKLECECMLVQKFIFSLCPKDPKENKHYVNCYVIQIIDKLLE